MKKIKHSFLLTEMLVCLSLMGLLLAITSFWQVRVGRSQGKDAIIHKVLSEENIFYKRLRRIYMDLYEELEPQDDEIQAFLFNRGVTKNPNLSGVIRGALVHKKEENSLILHLSNPRALDKEEYVLLTNVLSVKYRENENNIIELIITRGEIKPFKNRDLTYLFLKDEIY